MLSGKDFVQLARSLPTSALIRLEMGQEQIVARRRTAFADLIAALDDRSTAAFAAETLDKMNYVPVNKYEALSYYLATGDFDRCLECGSQALPRLIAELRQGNLQLGLPLALAKTGDPEASKALVDEFADGNKHPELPRALIGLNDSRILDVAIERLRKGDSNPGLVKLLAAQDGRRALDAMIERHLTEVRKGTVMQFNPTLARTLGQMGKPQATNALLQSYNLAVAKQKAIKKYSSRQGSADNRASIIGEALRESDDRPRSLLDVLLGRRRWAG